ncbi:MAG TPA: hypothetical protein PKO36_14580, partial [Candidatus Hydrogenedentes bacterium]|nr:hypothetical protein [Candidatus Hydrogenedentota bacterium]
ILVELELPMQVRQTPATPAAQIPEPAGELPPLKARTPASAPVPPPQPVTSPVEKDILAALSPNGSFVDEIAAACRISISEALSTLTMLELRGLVRQFSGKRFARA